MRFCVSVPVLFVLEKIVEAGSLEEVVKMVERLEPEDFDNFGDFYEWLGSKWEELRKRNLRIKIENLGEIQEEPEILEWKVVKSTEIDECLSGDKVIRGKIKFAGVTGDFECKISWLSNWREVTVTVSLDLPDDIVEYVEMYITKMAGKLFE